MRKWGGRAGFSILDQSLVSGVNFALQIVLARTLDLDEYGAFSVAFSIFLFLAGFHNALILEPMSVLGVSRERSEVWNYLVSVLGIHLVLTVILSIIMLIISQFLSDPLLYYALLGVILGTPAILLFWLMRRAYYVDEDPAGAALGSVAYSVLFAGGLALIWRYGWQSAFAGYLLMATASALTSAAAIVHFRARYGSNTPIAAASRLGSVFREHWHYGRWIVIVAVLMPLTAQAQVFIAAELIGLDGAGVLRALLVLILPMAQVNAAISTVGLPIVSGGLNRNSAARPQRTAARITIGLTAAALIYEFVLIAFSSRLENLLYGGRFAEFAWALPILGLQPVLGALGSGYALLLRAAQRSDLIVLSALLTCPVAILSAGILIWNYGIGGATLSITLTQAAALFTMHVLYRSNSASLSTSLR